MKIEVTLVPLELGRFPENNLSTRTCVVFDVLRATSTMITALEYGVRKIYPAADIDEALNLKMRHPDALLGGERLGEKIDGFNLGNSPLEYRDIAGSEVISTTTNGTVALRACAGAREVLAASLLNIAATANYLLTSGAETVRIICAGTGKRFAFEDAVGGGALIAALPGAKLDDAGIVLSQIWKNAAADPFAALSSSVNGSRLIARGRADEVHWCSQINASWTVGRIEDGCLEAVAR